MTNLMSVARDTSFAQIMHQAQAFVAEMRRRWMILLLTSILGVALGIVYYYFQKPKYYAATTFILEEKSSSGGLAGLASQMGINLGGLTSSGGGIFSGDNILDILPSKRIVNEVLLSRTDTLKGSITLADRYLDFSGLGKKLSADPALANIRFSDIQKMTPLQDSVLNVIYAGFVKKNLGVGRVRKQGSIIQADVTAPDPIFARLMCERLVIASSEMYINLRTSTSLTNIERLQRRSDSLLYLLNNKSFAAASSQLLDMNPGMRSNAVPSEIATRDKAVLGTLYTEVTKNLEASKLLLSQQTPVVQILDTPPILLKDNRLGLTLLAVAGFLVFATIGISILLMIYLLKLVKHQSVNLEPPNSVKE